MPMQHLLKQVELYRAKRNNRDSRPTWVTDVISNVAEMFEPFSDLGRVGFDCQFDENRWTVGMFLGSTELVGGKDDGHSIPSDFDINIPQLIDLFDHVDSMTWSAWPSGGIHQDAVNRSFITIEGFIVENPFQLQIHAIPPQDAGPGFRQSGNGEREPT